MADMEQQWRRAVSMQRKRAVMACFRMIPLYNISRSDDFVMFCNELLLYSDTVMFRLCNIG